MKVLLLGALALAVTASAARADETPECYDAAVYGRVVHQVPSEFPDCGPDCIILQWPWFVDLKVERIISGNLRRGTLSVLSVQHMHLRANYRTTWWLRRNTEGGYNVVSRGETATFMPCPAGTAAAKPYLRPHDGQTLDDLRRAAEHREAPEEAEDQ